jgi:hypothetical protein
MSWIASSWGCVQALREGGGGQRELVAPQLLAQPHVLQTAAAVPAVPPAPVTFTQPPPLTCTSSSILPVSASHRRTCGCVDDSSR